MRRTAGTRRVWLPAIGIAILVVGIAVTGLGTSAASGDAPLPIAGGQFQPSAVAHVPGTQQFLFVDDDRYSDLFVIEIGDDARQHGTARRVPLAARVTDMEGLTFDGTYFYAVGSQSKPTGADGDGLVRFRYDPVARQITNVDIIVGLKAWLSRNIVELEGVEDHEGDHVLNIEGLAWDPVEKRLLLGLRAPVIDGFALIVPVRLEREDAPFTSEHLRPAGQTIRLSLGGAGIRSIEFDERERRYQIITGATLNEEILDFQVLDWDLSHTSKPVFREQYAKALKPEGVTWGRGQDGFVQVMVFDTGLLKVSRRTTRSAQ
jgi:hypothetical protein